MASGDISIEPLLNLRTRGRVSGVTTNRQVTLTDGVATQITPTSGCKEMHIFNPLNVDIRYGGSGVTTSTGGKIFPQGNMAISPTNDFSFYLIQTGGSSDAIDVVEFF